MSIASIEKSLSYPENFVHRYVQTLSGSILFFLSIGGSVIPLHIMESDSIASVKLRIQNSKGFFVRNQKLVFEGRELARNDSRVCDYGVSDGNVLHLMLKLPDLQAITVRTVCGKKFEFHIARGRNAGYVKEQIAKKGNKDAVVHLHVKDQELVCNGEELEDQRLIAELCKNKDAVVHLLLRKSVKVRAVPVERDFEVSIEALKLNEGPDAVGQYQGVEYRVMERKPLLRDFILEPLVVNFKVPLPPVIKELIDLTFDGLKRGHKPIQSSEGSGGAYFMQDSSGQKYVSVFKPIDEEPMAVNNPHGRLPLSVDGEGLKKGTRVGEGAFREVAAYLLDHPMAGPRSFDSGEKGFAGVPPTVMVKCLHKGFNFQDGYEYDSRNIKIGSLQIFVNNVGSCEDMGPRAFPVDEVHKISVLDIRLANADRHAGNILVTRNCAEGQVSLVPIDHGYCLPENFEDCTFDWVYWPQAHEPYSPDAINYIKSLDAEYDIELLKIHGWHMPPKCSRTLRISTVLLKKGAERGLTPFAIGRIMCRETVKEESIIEQIVKEAEEALLPGMSDDALLEAVALIMDQYLDKLPHNR